MTHAYDDLPRIAREFELHTMIVQAVQANQTAKWE